MVAMVDHREHVFITRADSHMWTYQAKNTCAAGG